MVRTVFISYFLSCFKIMFKSVINLFLTSYIVIKYFLLGYFHNFNIQICADVNMPHTFNRLHTLEDSYGGGIVKVCAFVYLRVVVNNKLMNWGENYIFAPKCKKVLNSHL
jgi:hypothetical protein